uniref:Uncharacterized protein n=1 Tax=Romanomermis culicivorax TaxID=13658 RepID=A0A915J0N2_ROMCU
MHNQIKVTKDGNESFSSCRSASGLGNLQVPLSCCKNIESTKGIFDDCATQIFENPCTTDTVIKEPANIYTRARGRDTVPNSNQSGASMLLIHHFYTFE